MNTHGQPRGGRDRRDEQGRAVYAPTAVTQPEAYTAEETARWNRLFRRQMDGLGQVAPPEFKSGLTRLGIDDHACPRLDAVSTRLHAAVGWDIIGVNGLLAATDFFGLLARRVFPVTWWLRDAAHEDYIVEPDLFHDTFGHLPLLAQPAVAGFMQHYGALAVETARQAAEQGPGAAGAARRLAGLARLYWFTVEFGLVDTPKGLRAYGGGLLSSHSESRASVGDRRAGIHRRRLDTDADWVDALRRAYEIDHPQGLYYVLPGLDALWRLDTWRLRALAAAAAAQPDLPAVPEPPNDG